MRHGLLIISAIALSALLVAAKAVPTSSLEGYWKGSGTIRAKSGTDNVRCRVRVKKSGGATFSFSATCATESGRYELSGQVRGTGGRYTGTVQAGNAKGGGRIQLSQSGRRLSVTASGSGGSARLSLSK